MYKVDRDTFEALVADAVHGLPDLFRDRIANLEFVVEDRPSREDYARIGGARGRTLLGVYRGIPLPRRHRSYHMTLPDRIVIFQQSIQRLARDRADLAARVRHVVHHEVAHYFGISDDRLRQIDAY